MSVSAASSSTSPVTESARSDGFYSLNGIVPDSVLDVSPVTQAGKDPLVAAVLEDITVYNKLAWAQQNTDWSGYETKFGPEMTQNAKAQQITGLTAFASNILFESSGAGISVSAVTTSTSGSSRATSSLTVASTPINGDTTSINVKTEADGSLTAFKNGQVWKSFAANLLIGMDMKLGAGDIALRLLSAKQRKSVFFA